MLIPYLHRQEGSSMTQAGTRSKAEAHPVLELGATIDELLLPLPELV
jgi:hypothetical protein